MGRSSKKKAGGGGQDGGWAAGFVRLLVTVVLVVGILYAAFLIISRTPGFRSYLEERFEDAFGVAVIMDEAAARANLDLELARQRQELLENFTKKRDQTQLESWLRRATTAPSVAAVTT